MNNNEFPGGPETHLHNENQPENSKAESDFNNPFR
jgi:hypothetical protein